MPEDAQEPGRGHLHPQSKARNLVEQDGSRGLHTFFQLQVNDDAAHRREAVRAVERALVCARHPLLSLLHRRVMRPHKAVQPFARACVAPDVLGIVVAMGGVLGVFGCAWRRARAAEAPVAQVAAGRSAVQLNRRAARGSVSRHLALLHLAQLGRDAALELHRQRR